MKTQKLRNLYLLEGCLCFFAVVASGGASLAELLLLPVSSLGAALRALSLHSPAGNAAAVALFLILGLLPLIPAWRVRKDPGWELLFLLLSCPAIWLVLYYVINPGIIAVDASGLSFAIYGCWVCFAILRWLRHLNGRARGSLLRDLSWLLQTLGAVCVFSAFYQSIGTRIRTQDLTLLGGLSCVVEAAPDLLCVWVILAAIRLAGAPGDGAAAGVLAHRCKWALGLIALVHGVWNLLQLLFAARLPEIQLTVELPLGTMAALLVVLLLSSLLRDYHALKEDSNLII